MLVTSPGPNVTFIISKILTGAPKAGIAAMFGIWTGTFVHVIMAAVGLSALLATSAIAFSIVKWVGAAYLVWLGYKALRAKDGGFLDPNAKSATKIETRRIYKQSTLIAILNPKTLSHACRALSECPPEVVMFVFFCVASILTRSGTGQLADRVFSSI